MLEITTGFIEWYDYCYESEGISQTTKVCAAPDLSGYVKKRFCFQLPRSFWGFIALTSNEGGAAFTCPLSMR